MSLFHLLLLLLTCVIIWWVSPVSPNHLCLIIWPCPLYASCSPVAPHLCVFFGYFRIIWLGSLTQKRIITSCRFRWLVLDWSPLSSSWIIPVSQNHTNAEVLLLFSRHQVNVMIISAPKYSNNWTKTSQSGCFDSSMIPPGFWVFMVIQMGWMLTVCLSVLPVYPSCLSVSDPYFHSRMLGCFHMSIYEYEYAEILILHVRDAGLAKALKINSWLIVFQNLWTLRQTCAPYFILFFIFF